MTGAGISLAPTIIPIFVGGTLLGFSIGDFSFAYDEEKFAGTPLQHFMEQLKKESEYQNSGKFNKFVH